MPSTLNSTLLSTENLALLHALTNTVLALLVPSFLAYAIHTSRM